MSNSSQPKDLYKDLTIDGKSIDDIIKECTIDLGTTGACMNDVTITSASGVSSYSYTSAVPPVTFGPIGAAGSTYTLSNLSTDTITLTGIDSYSAFNIPVEWVDCLPPLSRIENMCKKYPGLKIAFENFRVFYEMVKDDYDNPVPKK